jgi:hypothetical protein
MSTSFKTHDPFVFLTHLDGRLPVHFASLMICLSIYSQSQHIDHTPTGYEDMVKFMIIVHTINMICKASSSFF